MRRPVPPRFFYADSREKSRYTGSVTIWAEIAAAFLAYIFVGWVFLLLYLALQRFIAATDVTFDYSWSRDGDRLHPNIRVRNHSKSRTYTLAGIAYRNEIDRLVWLDNKSLMGKQLKPLSVEDFQDIAPVRNGASVADCMQMRVMLRLESGRSVWLEGQGPASPRKVEVQRAACMLRDMIDHWAA